jgi:hypothetical protein
LRIYENFKTLYFSIAFMLPCIIYVLLIALVTESV